MSSEKPQVHTVARHYKTALADSSSGSREVVLRSFLTKGDIVEMISAEDARMKDDAYIQGIREEILQKPPYNGDYARKMGLFHIATRRVSHDSNDVLKRHTGPKKINGRVVKDELGQLVYYPRMYILRMITPDEKEMDEATWTAHRRKVLVTAAHILLEHEKAKRKSEAHKGTGADHNKTPPPKKAGSAGSPGSPARQFSATKFHVPKTGWDVTPAERRPLDWYITDQMVAAAIESMYVEQEVGGWHMFSENVPEADCFFSPPYSYVAKTYGFRNPGDSSVWLPTREGGAGATVDQGFDAGDVLPLG